PANAEISAGGSGLGSGITVGKNATFDDVTITVNAAITATDAGIFEGKGVSHVNVTVNDSVTATYIGVAASGSIEVSAAGSVTADVGINSLDPTTVINAGSIEGTGGTAVRFSGGDDTLEMRTTGTLNGNATGGSTDTLVLAGGTNSTASFDLGQISGFGA